MDDGALELGSVEGWLMTLHKKHGRIALIVLSTITSVLGSVALVLLISLVLYGEYVTEDFLPHIHFMILVPLIIAPVISSFLVRLLDRLDFAYQKVTELSTTDALTGSANRRGFLTAANQNIHTLRDADKCMVGMVDLDKFKQINDTYGHQVGDEVLSAVAVRLNEAIAEHGVVGRLGGDEFAFIALGTSDALKALDEKVNQHCSEFPLESGLQVYCSIGMVMLEDGESIDEVLARADRRLYEIKQLRHAAR